MVATSKQYEDAGGSNVTDIRDASSQGAPQAKAKEQPSMSSVRRRLEMLKFDEKDASSLTALREWAEANIDQMAREFYEFQFQQPEIGAKVTEVGTPRAALETAQGDYAKDFFRGWPDEAYIAKRQVIGQVHARIGVTPELYVSSYQLYFDILYPMITKFYGRNTKFYGRKKDLAARAIGAVGKLMLFDQALIMDVYIQGLTDRIKDLAAKTAHDAQPLVQASTQAKAAAEKGATAVQETIEGMERIAEASTKVNDTIGQLSKSSDEIGAVVETIDSIAEQTNLLALNAAIEAARAGEHGAGFAVVADEVRKLAERSQRETSAISTLIEQIRTVTTEAVQAVSESSSEAQEGANLASTAGESLKEILESVTAAADKVQEIATSATAMAKASSEMSDQMTSISSVVEENSASTEEMAASAESVGKLVDEIATVSRDNSAAADEIQSAAEEIKSQVSSVESGLNGLVADVDDIAQSA